MYTLVEKVAMVTGGANGIGKAIVRQLAEQGAKYVAILDIDEASGTALENELLQKHGKNRVKFIKCDVTVEEELSNAYEVIKRDNGYIDIVVNNAGIANEDYDVFRKQIEINYTALVASTLKALQIMRTDKGGKGGTVINISSVAALFQSSPFLFVYSGTKSAILQFSNCIGMEGYYSKTGVRVLAICFGATDTNIVVNARSFDSDITKDIHALGEAYITDGQRQSADDASERLVEAYKNGESGSTWLIKDNKCLNITSRVKEAYEILSKDMFN